MAWGLEARVPFLDEAFLDVAMNIDPKEKMFTKGAKRVYDKDGCERMEKVSFLYCQLRPFLGFDAFAFQYVLRKRSMLGPARKFTQHCEFLITCFC